MPKRETTTLERRRTRHDAPIMTEEISDELFPLDLLGDLGHDAWPDNIYVLENMSQGTHATVSLLDGDMTVHGLACYPTSSMAVKAAKSTRFSTLNLMARGVTFDDARAIAFEKDTDPELNCLVLLQDPKPAQFHYIR